MKNLGLALLALGFSAFSACAQDSHQKLLETSVELGQVKWQRDLDAAKKKSEETGKPLFVQFQEVPG